jgi:hypothetical protein
MIELIVNMLQNPDRIESELKDIITNPPTGFIVEPNEKDSYKYPNPFNPLAGWP